MFGSLFLDILSIIIGVVGGIVLCVAPIWEIDKLVNSHYARPKSTERWAGYDAELARIRAYPTTLG
jgi:hypothetical protein